LSLTALLKYSTITVSYLTLTVQSVKS
jgi:hypothetical protein